MTLEEKNAGAVAEFSTREYPERTTFVQMQLVRVLTERLCWADILQVAEALAEVHRHTDGMRKERELFRQPTPSSLQDKESEDDKHY